MIDIIALLIICYVQYHVWKFNRPWIPLLLILLFLPGCNSFGLTPGYREKHPDLLENVRHFYREPLWTRKIHHHHQRRN